MNNLLIKVCGMKDPENIEAVANLDPDYMGFIFYDRSPRYAGSLDPIVTKKISPRVCKVGVFVNETASAILKTVDKYQLQAVQLHGNETPATCRLIKKEGVCTIKALPIGGSETVEAAKAYTTVCDFLLFDTKTDLYGGSGQKFNWEILNTYRGRVPFFLSGGISASDIYLLMQYRHIKAHAVDVNSGFEITPGIKDIHKLANFIRILRSETRY
jgi:phosphoribosylanthranilate isomerase